jgi:squalene-associated FAD-dependent desaturase
VGDALSGAAESVPSERFAVMSYDAIVIGAGFAGLSAAVRLAAEGCRVVVLEEGPRLGGRATSFTDRQTGERVDNGQHVLFGCYRETYRFLRAIGSAEQAPLQRRLTLTFAGAGGALSTLACPPLPPPWHLIAGVLGWHGLPWRDRASALGMAGFIGRARRRGAANAAAGVSSEQTVDQWLAAQRQSRGLCDWLWTPLAFAALNQSPAVAAARPFARVVAELFGPRADDAAVGLSRVPLDELFAEPARRFLEAHGSEVRVRASGRVRLGGAAPGAGPVGPDQLHAVRVGHDVLYAPVVVSTVPWHAFARLWDGNVPAPLTAIAARASAMASSPIVTVNLWLDSPALPSPFVGLIGGPMHWVFDKSAIVGPHAGHLSIVASGADELAEMDNAGITRAAFEQLRGAIPTMRTSAVLRSVVVRESRATFSLAPGRPERPGVRTPVPGFYLAGDWTDTGLPATIEGAVTSGHWAAEAVLAERGTAART